MTGGCFCGAVRYEVSGPVRDETNCHCSLCRRTTGAPFVTWFTVDVESFHVIAATPTTFASSDHGTRSFCSRCGTQITFQSARLAHEIDVTTCSLDDPEQVPPRGDIHTSAKVSWARVERERPGGG